MNVQKGKVIKSYKAAYPEPWRLSKGDRVTISPKDSEWSGWAWATDVENNSRWIPHDYLDIDNDIGILKFDYDATELTVELNEELQLLKKKAGWFWCEKTDESAGWVPGENIEIIGE